MSHHSVGHFEFAFGILLLRGENSIANHIFGTQNHKSRNKGNNQVRQPIDAQICLISQIMDSLIIKYMS